MRTPPGGSFGLAQIFFGPFANLLRRRRAARIPGRRIAFESLESRLLLSADVVFNLPGLNDQAILEDDGIAGNGISQIRSQSGTFGTMTFSDTAPSVTINMGGDNGSLAVASLPDYGGALAINGQGGMDSVVFAGAAALSALAVTVGGAINDAPGSLHVAGNASFSGSSIIFGNPGDSTNFGTLTFNAAGTAVFFEDSDMTLAETSTATVAILTAEGSITQAAGGSIRAINSTLTAGTHIGAAGAGALDVDMTALAASSGNAGSGGIFINDLDLAAANGLRLFEIIADGGTGAIEITTTLGDIADGNFTNVNLHGSAVTLSAGRHIGFNGSVADALDINATTLTAVSAGQIRIDDIEGALTVDAIDSAGDVALGAFTALTVAGDVNAGKHEVRLTSTAVTLASAAVLHVDLGGTATGQYTRYTISGAASLGGTLDAGLVDGFTPAAGDRFQFMSFGSSTGDFATKLLPEGFSVEAHAAGLELLFSPNEPPVFVEIEDQSVEEGGELRFIVEAVDDPAQTLTFSAELPDGASFDPDTREFVWLPLDDAEVTVTFTVTDSRGAQDVMEVVLTAVNVAPVVDAGADQLVGLQDIDKRGHGHHKAKPEAEVSITAALRDRGLGDTHTAMIDWGDGSPVSAGTVVEPSPTADGVVKGEHAYTQAGTYTVTVTVTDDDGGTHSDTLVITVKKPIENKKFDSRPDAYKLHEDSVLTVNAAKGVLANDRGPAGATLLARLVEGPRHGELVFNADGSFTYVPDADFHGKDSFSYEFTDGNNVSRAVEVKLHVKNVPDRPAPRPCVDWHGSWHGSGHGGWSDAFQPFGKKAWR